MMEINRTYPKSNTLVNQLPSRDQKAGGVEELAEPKKTVTPNNDSENSEQLRVADTFSFSSESQRLVQSANTASVDSRPGIANREQAQQVVGQLISNPEKALAAYGAVSSASVGALLS